MLVWGSRDPVIPFAHARLAHAAMPGSRLETLEGAGHFPYHTDPQWFLDVVRDFLATTAPASHSVEAWRRLLRQGRPEPSQPRAADLLADPIAASGT
jgi:hypothetical protein